MLPVISYDIRSRDYILWEKKYFSKLMGYFIETTSKHTILISKRESTVSLKSKIFSLLKSKEKKKKTIVYQEKVIGLHCLPLYSSCVICHGIIDQGLSLICYLKE